jgi:hypothetical protein
MLLGKKWGREVGREEKERSEGKRQPWIYKAKYNVLISGQIGEALFAVIRTIDVGNRGGGNTKRRCGGDQFKV